MSEFKLPYFICGLQETLKKKGTPEQYFQKYLQKSINANRGSQNSILAVQSHVQQLLDCSNDKQTFLSKYENLKEKNPDCLEAYVELIKRISHDSKVKSFLQETVHRSHSKTSNTLNAKANLPQENPIKTSTSQKLQKKNMAGKVSEQNGLEFPMTPSVSSWVQRRPSMSWDFSKSSINLNQQVNTIPGNSQENMIIEDLLNILMGLPGNFIEAKEIKDSCENREFVLNDSLDPSLRDMVKQILPLASHYSMVQRFVEEKTRFEFGQINNALAECMYTIVVDYLLFITKLESEHRTGNLDITKMWYYVQKNLHALGVVSNIAVTINKSDSTGGKVLSLLHDNIAGYIGDVKSQDLCVELMQAACVPYMKMLGMWIYKGIISDPIQEFLVEDTEITRKEDNLSSAAHHWDRKYTIRKDRIPKFLEPVSDIILRAGKYLNVIRQCGKALNNKVQLIEYKKEEKHYIESIEKAYKFASQTLLDLVLKEQDLLGRLRSVKHYFLLDQGDFIVTFLTLCEKELSKDVADIAHARIDSLLDLALRISSAVNDPYKDDLRTELLPYDLRYQMYKILMIETYEEENYVDKREHLSVIDSFSFSYEVHWPISLILDRKSLACYQMIFRHLLYCKYVERMICQVWKANKVAKKFHMKTAMQYRSAFALRQRMLHCVQNLEYHMMVEVIEPHWCVFLQKMSKITNVDEVLTNHSDFLNSCLKDCMLTIPALLDIVLKLLGICVEFCKFMQLSQRYFVEAELGSLPNSFYESFTQAEPVQALGQDAMQILSFEEKINKMDLEFTAALMNLLDQINNLSRDGGDHDRLFNLLYRLDFNVYYSDRMKSFSTLDLCQDISG